MAKGRTPHALVAVVVSALALAGCGKTPEPDASSTPPGPASGGAPSKQDGKPAPSKPAGPSDVAYEAPAAWQKAENPSPMRKATYRIPAAQGDAEGAELSVSQAGGTVDMNVKRWGSQFEPKTGDVKRTEKRVGDLKVTVVEIHGTYNSGGMGGVGASTKPKEGWALLGAIVETTPPTFFKMTGPDKTVTAAKADFDKFVDSFRPK